VATKDYSSTYAIDQQGGSSNGTINAQAPAGTCTVAELGGGSDGVLHVGEAFTVTYSDPTLQADYGGTYIYRGVETGIPGIIGEKVDPPFTAPDPNVPPDERSHFYFFSNVDNGLVGRKMDDFSATDTPICFLAGTLIATPAGTVAVEDLAIGETVLTADSRIVLVTWVGRQTVMAPFGMPEGRRPVVITAGALAENMPARDLRLTSDHALLIDDVLVQAGALVNGSTIRRIPNAELGERFMVFHIETENHEVILAEGTPAETFVDNVSRRRFDNYAEYVAMYGEASDTLQELPQPRAMSARQVPPSIRARIARRATALAKRSADVA
jgi:hypothetical protein